MAEKPPRSILLPAGSPIDLVDKIIKGDPEAWETISGDLGRFVVGSLPDSVTPPDRMDPTHLVNVGSKNEPYSRILEEKIVEANALNIHIDKINRILSKGKIKLPDGFYPHTFVTFLVQFMDVLPTLGKDLAKRASSLSTDEEISPGIEVINRLEENGLILFASKESTRDPSLFIAAKREFTNPDDLIAADNLLDYFDKIGEFDAPTGKFSLGDGPLPTIQQWIEKHPVDIRQICEEAKLSRRVVHETLIRLEKNSNILLRRSKEVPSDVNILVRDEISLVRTDKTVVETIKRLFGPEAREPIEKEFSFGEHSYMRAIEMQYSALEWTLKCIAVGKTKRITLGNTGRDAAELWQIDANILKRAETFCWFDEPMRAVVSAAVTMPSSVRLDRDLTSAHAGWWYFIHPLECKTTPVHDTACAIAWSWTTVNHKDKDCETSSHGVLMTAYVYRDNIPTPSTQFFWGLGQTLQTMLIETEKSLLRNFVNDQPAIDRLPITMAAVERMARFFAAGNLWIQQKILVHPSRRMERHARKRLERDKSVLRPLSDVQIIQLRRREVIALSDRPKGDSKTIDWRCRWIVGGVTGFWRNHWYPSKGYHQPIHIDPFIKGPDDKPLKVPTHRVYAVKY